MEELSNNKKRKLRIEAQRNYDNFIWKLRQTYNCKEMQHAFRFNNIIDVYKDGRTVYLKKENTYNKFPAFEDLKIYVIECLRKYPYEGDYEVKDKISYKDLVTKVIPAAKANLDAFKPEDYHWKENQDNTSEDHLYFLFHAGFVKIGRSKNVGRRLEELKTSLSCTYNCYVLPRKGFLEKKMHHVFSEFRSNREWFIKDIRMTEFITKRYKYGECYLYREPIKVKPARRKKTA